MVASNLACPACGGPVMNAPVVLCPRCGAPTHTLCAAGRPACARCGAALPYAAVAAALAVAPAAATAPVAPPAVAFTCPRCGAAAQVVPGVQQCSKCQGHFTLRAGCLVDAEARPPAFDPNAKRIKVRWAGGFAYHVGAVEAQGVVEGMADPVTGAIPMEQAGVAFGDIFTVAVWRKIDVVRLVIAGLLPVPLTLVFLYGMLRGTWGLVALAAPFGLISALMIYGAVGARACYARVAGRYRTITVRFDRPPRRRRRFHDELLRRAGIAPSPIP